MPGVDQHYICITPDQGIVFPSVTYMRNLISKAAVKQGSSKVTLNNTMSGVIILYSVDGRGDQLHARVSHRLHRRREFPRHDQGLQVVIPYPVTVIILFPPSPSTGSPPTPTWSPPWGRWRDTTSSWSPGPSSSWSTTTPRPSSRSARTRTWWPSRRRPRPTTPPTSRTTSTRLRCQSPCPHCSPKVNFVFLLLIYYFFHNRQIILLFTFNLIFFKIGK